MIYKRFIKRFLDAAGSLIAITVLFPLLLIVAAVIKISSPGPIFFKQKRIGIHKTYFNILKFRTMRTSAPSNMPTHLLENPDCWITGIGRLLRKTSLDELPQLIQILTGKMSFIGPRPALWNQADLVAARDQYGANDIRPGLTGWAQINGRDELPIEVKARLDGEYVRRQSFWFDMKCFFGTIGAVLKRDGIVEGKAQPLSYTEMPFAEQSEMADGMALPEEELPGTGAAQKPGDETLEQAAVAVSDASDSEK